MRKSLIRNISVKSAGSFLISVLFLFAIAPAVSAQSPDSLAVTADSLTKAVSDTLKKAPANKPSTKGFNPVKPRINPVETEASMTVSKNEVLNDTAKINKLRRERSTHYHNDKGQTIYIDTITGEEWMDTLAWKAGIPKMEHPLIFSASAGVNIWDGVMRLFGQDYGLASAWAELNMHNRYLPRVEIGLGTADHWPDRRNFHYKSPVAPYFKIGCRYNFFYNSNPDYLLMAGLNYGFSSFKYDVSDVTFDSPYWDENSKFSIPRQTATVGWMEVSLGLRVKLFGPISAGWSVIFHSIIHQGKPKYGKPWYVPGYGTRGTSLTGEFSISYTLPLNKKASIGVDNNKGEAPAPGLKAEDGASPENLPSKLQ